MEKKKTTEKTRKEKERLARSKEAETVSPKGGRVGLCRLRERTGGLFSNRKGATLSGPALGPQSCEKILKKKTIGNRENGWGIYEGEVSAKKVSLCKNPMLLQEVKSSPAHRKKRGEKNGLRRPGKGGT